MINSEAKKAGLKELEKEISKMTDEELKDFRITFDPDMMGFFGEEGIDE